MDDRTKADEPDAMEEVRLAGFGVIGWISTRSADPAEDLLQLIISGEADRRDLDSGWLLTVLRRGSKDGVWLADHDTGAYLLFGICNEFQPLAGAREDFARMFPVETLVAVARLKSVRRSNPRQMVVSR